MVTEGSRLADVGTDHAYLPVYLVSSGKIPCAFAMDINEGPLERARDHIASFGLEDKISTRRSDGLGELAPGEADSVSVCGMGGALTIRILEEGSGVLERLWLYDHGFTIDDEDMVLEDGKYYPILHCIHAAAGEKQNLTGAEAYYGPVLLRKKHPILRQFLLYEQEVQEKILAQLANASARTASARKEEVRAVLRRNREVLDGMRE